MDKYIGRRIEGRYEITDLIGVGGMANVYRAYDLIEGRVVAVKILRDEYLSNEDFIRRFKNESKAIAVLSHPNIVKVYDVCFTDKIQSIVMEYIDGITLKEYIDQQRQIKWKEAVYFTEQILRALQHAHRKGIVHRDIKPQNIMLTSDGTIKVMDFGIARFARYETKTMTDVALGSVHYISPEQARGEAIDEKTDLYSMGVMLFEMLTGELPFEADSPVSVAIKQIQAVPKRPREINPDIPEGLEEITQKAMQKDVAKRYQTAEEMLRDMERFKNDPSVRFEYKYFVDENPTRYYTAVNRAGRVDEPDEYDYEEEDEDERRRSPLIPILSGVATAFVICAIAFAYWVLVYLRPFDRVEDIKMPSLIGLRYDQIDDYLDKHPEYKDLNVEVVATKDSAESQEGIIIEQDPKEGRSVKPNVNVYVTVSSGEQSIPVMDVANMEAEAALQKLRAQGFEAVGVEISDDKTTAGFVVKTDPPANTKAMIGDVITVFISTGAEKVDVKIPPVENLKLEDAKRILEAAGLKVGNATPVDSDKEQGVVVSQSPPSGETVEKGSTVDLEYASGNSASKTVSFDVPLPPGVSAVVTMTALQNGEFIQEEQVQPMVSGSWRVNASGVGYGSVSILYNGQLYQEYMIDFDSGQHYLEVDNSASFRI